MIRTPRLLMLLPAGGAPLLSGVLAGTGRAAQVVAVVPSLGEAETDGGGAGRVVADLKAGLPVADGAMDMVAGYGIHPADPVLLVDEARRVLAARGQIVFSVELGHLRHHGCDLPGLSSEEVGRVARALSEAVDVQTRHGWEAMHAVMDSGRAGLQSEGADVIHMTQRLDHRDVEAYLHTATPVAPAPFAAVRSSLDERAARRYQAACHRAVDVHGALTLRTPMVCMRARRLL